MTADEYLQSLLAKYRVTTGEGSPAFIAANAIYPILQEWATSQLRKVQFSGSYSKGTAIKGTTDVDLFISLKSDTKETLKELFDSLYNWVVAKGYPNARKQNVSIHIVHKGIEIDLVPAVHYGDNSEDHWLYVNKRNRERVKTNIDTHISTVQSSGRTSEIVIAKIWRKDHQIEFPSFYLELAIIEALKYKKSALADNFFAVLDYFSGDFSSARFVDPSNTNNIISDDLTIAEKKVIKDQAYKSRREQYWETIVW